MRFWVPICCVCCCTAACALVSCGSNTASYSDFNLRDVTLPDGKTIRVETMISQPDQMRGLMFRASLAPDRGMLFIHQNPGLYSTWMYQHQMPLDVIWMDGGRRIVEMMADAPPCHTAASQCPHYGGTKISQYMLEIRAGVAAKHGLRPGQRLEF